MSILVDDSNKTACRAAEAGLQQKNCAALVRPAGTGKGCIVWELLDAHPEMRVLWVVSCTARLELRRALTKRLGRTLGGRVEEEPDGLVIAGGGLRGGTAEPCGDHRLAMAAGVAALACSAPVTVKNAECVGKSYPDWWARLTEPDRAVK